MEGGAWGCGYKQSLVFADIRMEFIFFKMAGEVADFGNFLSVRGKRICVQC